jgi:hypothetical protein
MKEIHVALVKTQLSISFGFICCRGDGNSDRKHTQLTISLLPYIIFVHIRVG